MAEQEDDRDALGACIGRDAHQASGREQAPTPGPPLTGLTTRPIHRIALRSTRRRAASNVFAASIALSPPTAYAPSRARALSNRQLRGLPALLHAFAATLIRRLDPSESTAAIRPDWPDHALDQLVPERVQL
jgi:hypothetical protein